MENIADEATRKHEQSCKQQFYLNNLLQITWCIYAKEKYGKATDLLIATIENVPVKDLLKQRQEMPPCQTIFLNVSCFIALETDLTNYHVQQPLHCFLAIDGGASCSHRFLRAMSFASLSETFVYKLFTSKDIILSLGSRLLLSKISLVSSELISMFAP